MPPLKYTPGFEIGRLTVIERRPKGRLLVGCQCGNIKEVSRSNVSSGDTRSCGCLRDETLTTHGMTGTHLHNVWLNILGRVRGQISAGIMLTSRLTNLGWILKPSPGGQ